MLEHSIDHTSSNLAKIKLFRSLFVGREDVLHGGMRMKRRVRADTRLVVGINGVQVAC